MKRGYNQPCNMTPQFTICNENLQKKTKKHEPESRNNMGKDLSLVPRYNIVISIITSSSTVDISLVPRYYIVISIILSDIKICTYKRGQFLLWMSQEHGGHHIKSSSYILQSDVRCITLRYVPTKSPHVTVECRY